MDKTTSLKSTSIKMGTKMMMDQAKCALRQATHGFVNKNAENKENQPHKNSTTSESSAKEMMPPPKMPPPPAPSTVHKEKVCEKIE